MASGNAIRGTRVGSGPMRWVDASQDRTEAVARTSISYWCANGHQTTPSFAADVPPPSLWECPRCGLPSGQDEHNPPARPRSEPYKTHLAYVKERRSDADAAAILEEAMRRLHERRPR
ncbi:RNA polymerase-binding protein RbpA [Luedemannella flava]|uniref:RNA polymerase-binding protein RbpA n=1 Tax=Luedemannella flava TaxID=349316 RepID=A0ABN2LK93_9ACTN